jgi:hypothetical protein
MVEDDLSTYPGYNDPVLPVDAGVDVLSANPVTGFTTLKAFWQAGAKVQVPMPLRLWNARCLILNGFADPDRMEKELNYDDGTPRRRVKRFSNSLQEEKGGRAWVQLYGSDYGGTTLGPFKVVFTLTVVEPLASAKDPGVLRAMWWKYWGNSLVNKAFKEQVWGIAPNHLAVIDTAYTGKTKAVRLVEQGREALRLVWNAARFPDLVQAPSHSDFKTVARRPGSDGENQVVMDAEMCKLASRPDTFIPYDPREDQYESAPDSEIGRDLRRIDFEPKTWQCMLNYGGVVKF